MRRFSDSVVFSLSIDELLGVAKLYQLACEANGLRANSAAYETSGSRASAESQVSKAQTIEEIFMKDFEAASPEARRALNYMCEGLVHFQIKDEQD